MPTFGARIDGVGLAGGLSAEVRALLRQAWLTYGVLIFDGPIHGLFRTALKETEIGGVTIPQGCRDFSTLPSHLGFGMGIHHCLGSNLARMEACVAIETLYRLLPNLRLADGFVPQQFPGAIFRTHGFPQMQYDGPVAPREPARPASPSIG